MPRKLASKGLGDKWGFAKVYNEKVLDGAYYINKVFSGGKGGGSHQVPCNVTVHDYGIKGDKSVYNVNGVAQDDKSNVASPDNGGSPTRGRGESVWTQGKPPPALHHGETVRTLTSSHSIHDRDELQSDFEKDFFSKRPEWATVRWIDVEGMNGDVVQWLLSVVDCEKQYTYNNILDLKQRVMGLLLSDGHEDAGDKSTKFLFVTSVPSLSNDAIGNKFVDIVDGIEVDLENGKEPQMYDIIDYEKISYVLKVDGESGRGTLISFQEGKAGDVFGDVRDAIRHGWLGSTGVSHLLMNLLRASTDSAAMIEQHFEHVLDQLQRGIDDHSNGDFLDEPVNRFAIKIKAECDLLRRTSLPFYETLVEITSGRYPAPVMGRSTAAWNNLRACMRRLNDNMEGELQEAGNIIAKLDAKQNARDEARQKNIESSSFVMGLVLAVFSPLAFISGIYGMNFIGPDGNPGMPELRWYGNSTPTTYPGEYNVAVETGITGYGYFWLLSGTILVAILILYVFAGLITNPFVICRRTCCPKKRKPNFQRRAAKGSSNGLNNLFANLRGGENEPDAAHSHRATELTPMVKIGLDKDAGVSLEVIKIEMPKES